MKLFNVALLMAVAGLAQASEPQKCGSAIDQTVSLMSATYGADPEDILVQVVSLKKSQKGLMNADILASTGTHKCALSLVPSIPRRGTLSICEWSIVVVSCDTPGVQKQTIIDEKSWADKKTSAKEWREEALKGLEKKATPAES